MFGVFGNSEPTKKRELGEYVDMLIKYINDSPEVVTNFVTTHSDDQRTHFRTILVPAILDTNAWVWQKTLRPALEDVNKYVDMRSTDILEHTKVFEKTAPWYIQQLIDDDCYQRGCEIRIFANRIWKAEGFDIKAAVIASGEEQTGVAVYVRY